MLLYLPLSYLNNRKELGKELGKEFSENQQKIIALIIQNPKHTIKEMGAIERVGGRRAGYWQYKGE